MSDVGVGSQTRTMDSDEEEIWKQGDIEEGYIEVEDGSDDDEDSEEDGVAIKSDDSESEEEEESEDAEEPEEKHCFRCQAEINANGTSLDIVNYCRPCVDANCKEMNILGSSVAENLKVISLLRDQLAKTEREVAGLRYQVTRKHAETRRLNMELKIAKLEARDAKKLLHGALESRKRPLQRWSLESPSC